jgi:predicted GNAT family N-acyltransferase
LEGSLSQKAYRGGVLGKELMRRSEEALYATGERGPIKIMAQSYLLQWYSPKAMKLRVKIF